MEHFAPLKLNKNQICPIAIIRDSQPHFIQLAIGQSICWNFISDFEHRYNATIRVNAGGNSFIVRFNY